MPKKFQTEDPVEDQAIRAVFFQSSPAVPISRYAGSLLFGDPISPLLKEIEQRWRHERSAAARIERMKAGGRK